MAQTVPFQLKSQGRSIDFTPSVDTNGGIVVIQSGAIGITSQFIGASKKGCMQIEAEVEGPKDSSDMSTIGSDIFWDHSNGVLTTTPTAYFFGQNTTAAGTSATKVIVKMLNSYGGNTPAEITSLLAAKQDAITGLSASGTDLNTAATLCKDITSNAAQIDAAVAITPTQLVTPEANKAAILDANAALSGTVTHRYATVAELDVLGEGSTPYVPLEGEHVYIIDTQSHVIGDGVTPATSLTPINVQYDPVTTTRKIGHNIRSYTYPQSTYGAILIGEDIVGGARSQISLNSYSSGISFRYAGSTGYAKIHAHRMLMHTLNVVNVECLKTPNWTADTDLANWTATNISWVESGTVRATNASFELSQTIANMDRPLIPGEVYKVSVKIKAFTSTVATDHILVYGLNANYCLDILANTLPVGGDTFTFYAKAISTSSGYRIRIAPSTITGTIVVDIGEISVKRCGFASTSGSHLFLSGYLEQPIGSPITSAATITPTGPCFHVGWDGTSAESGGTAVITFKNCDHAFTTSSTPTIYWNDGAPKSRVGMTVTAYDATAGTITVTAASGSGDTYPTGTASVAVDNAAATINTINSPISGDTGFSGSIQVIPSIPCAFGTGGNIAKAVTGVVGQMIVLRYDYYTGKWYPTY